MLSQVFWCGLFGIFCTFFKFFRSREKNQKFVNKKFDGFEKNVSFIFCRIKNWKKFWKWMKRIHSEIENFKNWMKISDFKKMNENFRFRMTTRSKKSPQEVEGPLQAKVVLLGAQGVGKTSLVLRRMGQEFQAGVTPTIGASYTVCLHEIQDQIIKLQIWDTAGQERFRAMVSPIFMPVVQIELRKFNFYFSIDFLGIQFRFSSNPPLWTLRISK